MSRTANRQPPAGAPSALAPPSAHEVVTLTLLGQAHLEQGRAGDAVAIFHTLATRYPTERTLWQNLGTALRSAGRLDEALEAYTRASAGQAESAGFLYNLGLLHLDREDLAAAADALRRALDLASADLEIRCAYAECLHRCMRTDEALDVLRAASPDDRIGTTLAARLARLYLDVGDPGAAEPVLERALGDPDPAREATLAIARVLERTNRVSEARTHISRLRPAGPEGEIIERLELEGLLAQRERRHEAACGYYRHALEHNRATRLRHHQLFPLARSLDALGRYDEAFAALAEAHASQVEYLERAVPGKTERGAHTMGITSFSSDAVDLANWDASSAPDAAASPIFIVGFPRSGTTLLEQAIDAHPALESMDEQPYLQYALDTLLSRGACYPYALAQVSEFDLSAARDCYWRHVRRRVTLAPGQRLVDKNPLNLLRLPAIRRLFPESPILLVLRHPCDVLMSCYMQHFRAPDFALLASDLERLAVGYARAMGFWFDECARLAPRVYEVRYERLAAQFDPEIRVIARFLSLRWDDAMLRPAERARARRFVSSPSYAQVVEPVNTRAIGRARPYLGYMNEALVELEPWLERFGYAAGRE